MTWLKKIRQIAIYFCLLASVNLCYGAIYINGSTLSAWNGASISSWNGGNVVSGGGGVTYQINESFENTGAPTGWTNRLGTGSTVDYDSTAHPTEGTQNIYITRAAGSSINGYVYKNFTTTNLTEVYMTFSYYTTTAVANQALISIDPPNDGAITGMILWATGPKLKIYADGASGSSKTVADTLSANTLYYIRAHWNHTTGAYDLEVNTSGTFDQSGTDYISGTDGLTTSVTFGEISVYGGSTSSAGTVYQDGYFDNMRVSASSF